MLLTEEQYKQADIDPGKFSLEVSDFNSLIAISQDLSKPVFALTQDDIRNSGSVAINQLASVDGFNKIYAKGAEEIVIISNVM